MFEKEAEEYAIGLTYPKFQDNQIANIVLRDVEGAFQKGAEFGYNKANEWHYPSNGEYPKEYKDLLICFLTEDDMKDCVRGWYEYDFENNKHIFKYLNVLGTQYLETVIAWKEIVLPGLKESE